MRIYDGRADELKALTSGHFESPCGHQKILWGYPGIAG
jgi:hypothetical protein